MRTSALTCARQNVRTPVRRDEAAAEGAEVQPSQAECGGRDARRSETLRDARPCADCLSFSFPVGTTPTLCDLKAASRSHGDEV